MEHAICHPASAQIRWNCTFSGAHVLSALAFSTMSPNSYVAQRVEPNTGYGPTERSVHGNATLTAPLCQLLRQAVRGLDRKEKRDEPTPWIPIRFVGSRHCIAIIAHRMGN